VRWFVVSLVLIAAGAACSSGSDESAVEATTSTVAESTTSVPVDCSNFHASVTEADAGREVQVGGMTSRFSICLDEARHPFRQLDVAGCPVGYVSNLSLAGPESYPIGYEVTAAGSCTVRNGDYQVRIVATE
jgi:hypothetical protein